MAAGKPNEWDTLPAEQRDVILKKEWDSLQVLCIVPCVAFACVFVCVCLYGWVGGWMETLIDIVRGLM